MLLLYSIYDTINIKNKETTVGDTFTTFIKNMLESKEWSAIVDATARDVLEEDLRARLMDQIDQAVVEAMPEDKIDGLNDLLDRGATDSDIQQFIASSGIDVQRITTETMLRFRDLYIGPAHRKPE